MKNKVYEVAEHRFRLSAKENSAIWRYLSSYEPFAAADADSAVAYTVSLVPLLEYPDRTLLWSGSEHPDQETTIEVYRQQDNYLFCIYSPGSKMVNAQMLCSADFCTMELALQGNVNDAFAAFYSAMMIAFSVATADKGTLLTHSSATVCGGRAYLFHAKSGTGKSTHSGLWRRYVAGADVLNDDHPILRVAADGRIMVYGSPWSGKTPCYKNQKAPLGAMVRLMQAPQNEITRLRAVEAYASLTTSCLSMTWERRMKDGQHSVMERIATTVPCYRLMCRPDREAVEVCYRALTGQPLPSEQSAGGE
jgi:hypothetical protein